MKYDLLARATSKSVAKHTGKTWDQWIARLESRGAHLLSYREIVEFLRAKHKLTAWWAQIVTLGFEQAIGRRVEGQSKNGRYTVSGSRTIYMSAKKTWTRLTSDEGIGIWLAPLSPVELKAREPFENAGFEGEGAFGEIRVVTKGKKVRFRWQDPEWEKPSVCTVEVIPRDDKKCLVIFSHTDLPSARIRESARIYWKNVLERLAIRK